MLRWLKYRWALWQCYRDRREIETRWAAERKAKREGKPSHDEESIKGYERTELWANEDERAVIETRWLIRKAYTYGLEVPQDEHAWDIAALSGQRLLAREALAKLRAAVRKERLEKWEFTFKLLTACTGIIGTLIGLVAILKK